jgi:4'-phosphopantetheinyl transferase
MMGADIHIWQIPLTPLDTAPDARWLDAEERRRAAAFKFDADRHRFMAAHAALRAALAFHACCAPDALQLATSADGKPYLRGSAWQFNLSHSENLALLAVTRGGPLGIDVERVRPLGSRRGTATDAGDELALAERHYSPAEVRHLQALPERERRAAFFCCWTRKEACVKALGTGIFTDLRAIEVGFDGGVRVGGLFVQGLHLRESPATDGFVAALATSGEPGNLRLLHYPEDLPTP